MVKSIKYWLRNYIFKTLKRIRKIRLVKLGNTETTLIVLIEIKNKTIVDSDIANNLFIELFLILLDPIKYNRVIVFLKISTTEISKVVTRDQLWFRSGDR